MSHVSEEQIVSKERSEDAVATWVSKIQIAFVWVDAVESPERSGLVVPGLEQAHEEHLNRKVDCQYEGLRVTAEEDEMNNQEHNLYDTSSHEVGQDVPELPLSWRSVFLKFWNSLS